MPLLVAWLILLLLAPGAHAHKLSDAYLRLMATQSGVSGSIDLALRDLGAVVDLDGNGDGAVTWGELKAQHAAIWAYVQSRVLLEREGQRCPLEAAEHLVDHHSDGAYAVIRLAAQCPQGSGDIILHYGLFFDIDPTHRGILAIGAPPSAATVVLSPSEPSTNLTPDQVSSSFPHFFLLGAEHMVTGIDHLLFLLVLLLPFTQAHQGGEAEGTGSSWRTALPGIVKLITAFTLAHGLSLIAATTGLVELPSRLVESVIALSILVTAMDNIWPFLPRARWQIAFGFGLFHGLGFAAAMGPLELTPLSLAKALVGFNLGIEAAQIAAAVLFLLAIWPIQAVTSRPWGLARMGSLGAAAMACIWLIDRLFGTGLAAF